MIYGIGIDIVHIPKFKKALEKWGDRFKEKIFTQNELKYCENRRPPIQHLAARFAAKEAFFKAFGNGIGFKEVEVINNKNGKPFINLLDNNLKSKNLKNHLTISHDADYCIAQVVIERV